MVGLDAHRAMIAGLPEKVFQAQILHEAKGWGWRAYHVTVAWRSEAGWLDLLMLRRCRLVVAELKTVRGKLTPKQREWLMAWWESGRCEGPFVWDPLYWHQIDRVLLPEGVEILT